MASPEASVALHGHAAATAEPEPSCALKHKTPCKASPPTGPLPAPEVPPQALLIAIPNIPVLSADGQTMAWYPGCWLAKVAKPPCESMSSTSMIPPTGVHPVSLLHLKHRVLCGMQAVVDEHLHVADLGDQRRQPLPA